MDVAELRPGLWRWTLDHPGWTPEDHWAPTVGSVFAELPEALLLVDPLVPDDPADNERFWRALDRDDERAGRPVHVLLTVHWHERSTEAVLERYGGQLWRPEQPTPLPGGVEPLLVHGADWVEAMFFLEPWHALVTGDLIIEEQDELRVPVGWFPTEEQDWARAGLKERLREAIGARAVELVLVSHGRPILENATAALERALAAASR